VTFIKLDLTSTASVSDAAVVMSSVELSPTGACAGAVVFNADGIDLRDIDMNRARVAMTSDKLVLQAFYGQSSYRPSVTAAPLF
jgi:hypothetical protein